MYHHNKKINNLLLLLSLEYIPKVAFVGSSRLQIIYHLESLSLRNLCLFTPACLLLVCGLFLPVSEEPTGAPYCASASAFLNVHIFESLVSVKSCQT